VTTKEIARASGYAEGTLYKHFETKEELFLAAIQELLPDVAETVSKENAGEGTLQQNLEAIMHAVIAYYEQLLPLAVSFFADMELLSSHRRWMQQQNIGPFRTYERVEAYIEAEQRLGRIDRQQSAFTIATLLLGPCFQYAFLHHFLGTNPLPVEKEQFVSDLVRTLVIGFVPMEHR
jgi:AcrR family transcriptional regulator